MSDAGLLRILAEIIETGVPADAAARAVRMIEDGVPVSDAVEVCLAAVPAQESTPTDEFVSEMREHLDPDDPDHRLYLPGRKFAQRTLSRTIPALVQTDE